MVNLIASTTTKKDLRVRAALDTDEYPTGVKVDDVTMAALQLIPMSSTAIGTMRSLRSKHDKARSRRGSFA